VRITISRQDSDTPPVPSKLDDVSKVDEIVAAATIAEYEQLRAEINRRSTEQHALISFALTGEAAIAALLASTGAPETVPWPALLVIPPVATALALLWVDHAFRIRQIGRQISEHLSHELEVITGNPRLLANETRKDEYRTKLPDVSAFVIALAIIFVVVPGIAVFIASSHSGRFNEFLIPIVIDLVLIGWAAIALARWWYGAYKIKPRPGDKAPSAPQGR
jgi:hypothetical protein